MKELKLDFVYDSSEISIMNGLIIPLLSNSNSYWRGVGFFSSGWIKMASVGIQGLVSKGGRAKIICSPVMSEEDWNAIVNGISAKESERLVNVLALNVDEIASGIEKDTLNALACLVADGLLEFKFAIIRENWGNGNYHDKVAVFNDQNNDFVAIHGSFNDSIQGTLNGEAFSVFKSWINGQKPFVDLHYNRLKGLWDGLNKQFYTVTMPDAIKNKIISLRTPASTKSIYDINTGNSSLKINTERDLWPHQKQAIEKWAEAGFRGILEMATGTGKTVTSLSAFDYVKNTHNKKLVLVILVPYLHLVEQWKEECSNFNLICFECSSSNPQWPMQTRSLITDFKSGAISTLCFIAVHDTAGTSRFHEIMSKIPGDKAFLIADEVHELGAKKRRGALLNLFTYRLGLSATPDRWYDDEGTAYLKNYFNDICFKYPLRDAIGKSLVPYKYNPIIINLTPDELKTYEIITNKITAIMNQDNSSDTDEQLKKLLRDRALVIAKAQNKKTVLVSLLTSLIETLNEEDKRIEKTLIYCAPGNHKSILEAVSSIGIVCHEFVHNVKISERKIILDQFADGDYEAIIAIKCLDQGVDIPSVKTAFILASSTNPREFVQRRGRILRRSFGKTLAEIYDFLVIPSQEYWPLKREVDMGLLRRELPRFSEFAEDATNTFDSRKKLWNVLDCYGLLHLLDKKPWDVYKELKYFSELQESLD